MSAPKPYRDPELPARPKPPEPATTWRCACGRPVLAHLDFCPACAAAKPAPQPIQRSVP